MSESPGKPVKMQIPDYQPNLLNQNSYEKKPRICILSKYPSSPLPNPCPMGNSDALKLHNHSSRRKANGGPHLKLAGNVKIRDYVEPRVKLGME